MASSDPAYPGDVASVYYGDVADPEPASVYSDAVADPEPAGYYTALSPGLATYDDAVADPEPQAYYDAIADPEPYGYPGGLGYDASDPEPAPAAPVLAVAAYDGASNSVVPVSGDFYDAVADPEPAGYYDPGYLGADPEPGADPEYYQYWDQPRSQHRETNQKSILVAITGDISNTHDNFTFKF